MEKDKFAVLPARLQGRLKPACEIPDSSRATAQEERGIITCVACEDVANDKNSSEFCPPPSGRRVQGNPLLSPFNAADSLLERLPPTYLVGLVQDPLLDDTLAMAARLNGMLAV